MIELLYGLWSFVTSRIGSVITAGVVCLAIGYSTGKEGERKRGEAATLRNQVAVLKRDNANAEKAAADATALAGELKASVDGNQGVVDGIEKQYLAEKAKREALEKAGKGGKAPVFSGIDGGILSPGEFKRLQSIR